MLRNYLVVALRTLRRQKGYAALNVVGLAVGLACSFFVLLWVRHEVVYDRFHAKADRTYRVMRHSRNEDVVNTWSTTPKPLADELERNHPEVERVTLRSPPHSILLTRGDESFREDGFYAGPAFFQTFSFPLVEGNAATALADPGSVVISARVAQTVFGPDWRARGGVVGQTLTVDRRKDFRIAGVAADVPAASSLQFDVVLPLSDFVERNTWVEAWENNGLELYAELREGADAAAFERRIAGSIRAHGEDDEVVFLQPLTAMRLYGEYRDGRLVGGRIEYVRLFGLVAVFLLAIAAINFTNLATARSALRAREIGVRKSIGAGRPALVRQLLAESVGLALVACALAFGLVAALLPAFGTLTGVELAVRDLDPGLLAGGLGLALLVGVLAGSYPALYLSSFSPITALRGTARPGPGAARLRRGLVVFQFALSTLLLVGTLTVYRQVSYIRHTDLGLDRTDVVTMGLEGPALAQYEAFRQELLRQPGIGHVTAADQSPLNLGNSTSSPHWEGEPEGDETLFYILNTGYDFVEAMEMEVVAGRPFSRALASDTANFLVNEQAARAMGLDDPIGQSLGFWEREGQIVGVVRDFHMGSFYTPVAPTIIRLDPPGAGRLFVRPAPGRTAEALASLEAVYGRFNPGYPFAYAFLDESFEELYRSETVLGALANVFAGVAVFVACLGLFGLAAFTAERRTKEVGIRKVLGAGVLHLVALLSREFLALVVVALVVAAPVAYLVADRWLDGFASHVELGPGVFAAAGALALLVALATVASQAWRAASTDPVEALRYE